MRNLHMSVTANPIHSICADARAPTLTKKLTECAFDPTTHIFGHETAYAGGTALLFRAWLLEHICHLHRRAFLPLAFVGGFHEREDLQRLGDADRRLAPLEELGHLDGDPLVAHVLIVGRHDAFNRHAMSVDA